MSKVNLSKIVKGVKFTLSKHSPEILTGIGIAGMITTTVMAVKATPKALLLIEDAKYEKDTAKLTIPETVQTTWKCYIPAAVTGALSVSCLIGASSVHLKRNAALATAYKLSETALTEYKDQVAKTFGEKKEQEVRDNIAKEHIEKHPVTKQEVIITEKGKTLCYDELSGRYFKSDIEEIRRAVNEINRQMIDEMSVSLNEFYYELGLNSTKMGDELGWNISHGMLDVNFSSQLADDGTPCLVVEYSVAPKYGYSKLL